MAGGEDYLAGAVGGGGGGDGDGAVGVAGQIDGAGAEMIFATMLENAFADVLDDGRKTVAADVGMGVDENLRVSPEIHELMQDLTDVAALGGAGEKLAVRESPCAALTEAIIAVRVDNALAGEGRHIEFAGVDILSALQDDGLETAHQKPEGGEHSRRAGSDDDDRFGRGDVLIVFEAIWVAGFASLVGFDAVSVEDVSAGVDGAAYDAALTHILGRNSHGAGSRSLHFLAGQLLADGLRYFNFLHISSFTGQRRGRPGRQ